MKENDLLEQKLRNQEDDFRLQNEALMKELAQVLIQLLYMYVIYRWHNGQLGIFITKLGTYLVVSSLLYVTVVFIIHILLQLNSLD